MSPRRAVFGTLVLGTCLLAASCFCGDDDGGGAATTAGGAQGCNPMPPSVNDITPQTGEGYVQVKASTYGASGGGIFIQVDVAEPGSEYTGAATVTVWTGSGDDTTGEAPFSAPPEGERTLRSEEGFTLNGSRSWGGGTVRDITAGDTNVWVFIRVALETTDTPPIQVNQLFRKTFSIDSPQDLPSGWKSAQDLN